MPRRTFTKEQLRAILWDEDEESEIILNEIDGKGRWSVDYRLVFKKDGKLYETSYSRGATEYQDSHQPWEYDDEVECVEVEAYERAVTDYRPVE